MSVFVLVAGPNGAGKSTFCSQVLKPLWRANYGESIQVLNPDVLAQELQKLDPTADPTEVNLVAVRSIEKAIPKYFQAGISVVVETVLSTEKYIPYWEEAPRYGFERILIYITVSSPQEALARIARRVKRGGHNVPPHKVEKRFWRSLRNFRLFARQAEGFLVFENRCNEGYFAVACGVHGKAKILRETSHPIKEVLDTMPLLEKNERVPQLLEDFCGPFPYLGPFPL